MGSVFRRLGLDLHQIPDPHVIWGALSAFAACFTVHHSDLLLTISNPPSSHVAGLVYNRLRAMRRRHIPWVAYCSDPWTDWGGVDFVVRRPIARAASWRLERAVFGAVDGVSFPSEELARHFVRQHPVLESKPVAIVPQSYDPIFDEKPSGAPERSNDDRMLLRYVGDLYGPRTPRPLLLALARVRDEAPEDFNRLAVELIGRWEEGQERTACEALMVELGNVRHQGPVAYSTSLALMREADVLLHLDVPTSCDYFRPSKLIEYLGARRPILGCCSPGAGERLVRQAGGLVADVRSPEQMADALRRLCEERRRGELERLCSRLEVRAEFTADLVAARMADFVREVIVRCGVSKVVDP
jgi:glycosyltransferase involved in cell wall biosynthesis